MNLCSMEFVFPTEKVGQHTKWINTLDKVSWKQQVLWRERKQVYALESKGEEHPTWGQGSKGTQHKVVSASHP